MIAATLSRMLAPLNATPENPSFNLNDPAAFEQYFGGAETDSGVKMTHHTALTLAPVWQAVSIISGDVASTTLNCYLEAESLDRAIDWSHPAQFLVSTRPNDEMSAFDMWRRAVLHSCIWGNGYLFIDRAGRFGEPRSMYNLLPDRTRPDRRPSGELCYVTEVDGHLEALYKEEVLHIKGLSLENGVGCDLVEKARDSFGLALAAQGFNAKYFKNGSQTGGILEIPAHLTEKAKQKLEEGFDKKFAGRDNWFKTVILRDGARFHATTVDAQKSQTHELREDQVRDVARFFNLPPSKLGLSDSVSYNSDEQSQIGYLTGCLRHWLASIVGECNIKLLTEQQLRKGHYFEHNISKIIELDAKTAAEVAAIYRQLEVLNPNEIRRKLNLNRRTDPGGEDYTNPATRSAGSSSDKPDTGKEGAEGEMAVDADTNVQATALNGAQIVALVDIANRLATEQLPPEGTRALIQAAFPAMPQALIDKMVSELDKFTPEPLAEPAAPPIAPAKEEPKEDADMENALRGLFSDTVNRVARRVCFDARTASKKPQKFAAWLDSNAQEHRTVFADSLLPTLRVVATTTDQLTDVMCATCDGRFFSSLLNELRPVVEPPFLSNDLQANVNARCAQFELTIAATLSELIFGKEGDAQ